MPRPLSEQVVVITGASSGIGRATAKAFGAAGGSVVCAARSEQSLDETVREVEQAGGRAVAVPTDVADWHQVQALAERAVAEFGRIDTWVSNAAVGTFGRATDFSPEEVEHVMRVNFFGQVYGMYAALPIMKRTGGGAIISVASIDAERPMPLHAPYIASKWAVRGWNHTVRMELEHDDIPVSVTTILPASIDTPFFRNALTRLGGAHAEPLPPVYRPEVVANVILSNAVKPQREVIVGGSGMVMALGQRIAPRIMDKALTVRGAAFRVQRGSRPDTGTDNLAQPLPGNAATRGDYEGHVSRTSVLTSITQRPIVSKAAALLAGTAVARRLVQRTGQQGAADAPGTEPGDAGAEQIDLTTGAPAPTQVPRPTDSTGQHRGQDQVAVDATTTDSGTADRPV